MAATNTNTANNGAVLPEKEQEFNEFYTEVQMICDKTVYLSELFNAVITVKWINVSIRFRLGTACNNSCACALQLIYVYLSVLDLNCTILNK